MKIIIDIKPVKFTGRTKQEVLNKALSGKSYSSGTHGNACVILRPNTKDYYTYTIQKHNAKWEQQRYKSGPKKGQYKSSIKIKDKEWVVYLYKFDIDLLKLTKMKLNQKDKTFTYQRDYYRG